jgi:uncharacterized protein YbaP (TraB family)
MSRMLKPFAAALAAAALFAALPGCAQRTPAPGPAAASDADPALWVVKDADTTIYLFGTIHVLRPGLSWFDEAVRKAFDSSATLVLEMVEPDAATQQKVVLAKAFDPAAAPLTTQLPPNYRAAFAKAMADGGMAAATYDRMRPWFASITLSILPVEKLGYDPANGPEKVLVQAARAAGKQVAGLETFAGQLGLFDGLSHAAQLRLLESTLDELPDAPGTMARMVDDWARGDPEALAGEMNDSLKDSPEVADALLVQRNRRWAGWIAQRMKTPGTVFVAVGAGHLAGPQSVQRQLRAYRLKARRIRY